LDKKREFVFGNGNNKERRKRIVCHRVHMRFGGIKTRRLCLENTLFFTCVTTMNKKHKPSERKVEPKREKNDKGKKQQYTQTKRRKRKNKVGVISR
jgi:hypothetical protein